MTYIEQTYEGTEIKENSLNKLIHNQSNFNYFFNHYGTIINITEINNNTIKICFIAAKNIIRVWNYDALLKNNLTYTNNSQVIINNDNNSIIINEFVNNKRYNNVINNTFDPLIVNFFSNLVKIRLTIYFHLNRKHLRIITVTPDLAVKCSKTQQNNFTFLKILNSTSVSKSRSESNKNINFFLKNVLRVSKNVN